MTSFIKRRNKKYLRSVKYHEIFVRGEGTEKARHSWQNEIKVVIREVVCAHEVLNLADVAARHWHPSVGRGFITRQAFLVSLSKHPFGKTIIELCRYHEEIF